MVGDHFRDFVERLCGLSDILIFLPENSGNLFFCHLCVLDELLQGILKEFEDIVIYSQWIQKRVLAEFAFHYGLVCFFFHDHFV